ncbi:unnamed protein product [Linum tenue]|uniref:ZF-HD dimerization-type domain-containing protein n=1 Tax=Linum tenue TaxID=586396 RepID=A0AAV0I5I3_9ROSI|nr:unnamed protein product [Linum tenue]
MPAVRYRECMRNHAASSGRHVVDGCGEFMPAGEEGTPAAFRCAACDCHRSFHRQEINGNHPAAPLPPPPPPPPLALPHPPPPPRYRRGSGRGSPRSRRRGWRNWRRGSGGGFRGRTRRECSSFARRLEWRGKCSRCGCTTTSSSGGNKLLDPFCVRLILYSASGR